MSKKRKKSVEAKPATVSETVAKPCGPEVLAQQLEAFIAAFVQANRRERARLMLIEKPARRREALGELHVWLDQRYCSWLEGREKFVDALVARDGDLTGVHLSEDGRAVYMTLAEAANRCELGSSGDAIFFGIPGKLGFWFDHDGNMIRCQR